MSAFGSELRRLRGLRGWSQMELSLEADVSTRHVSFLETGRASPSRSMIHRLGVALDLPLRQQNQLLLAAGFAPAYGETDLGHPRMARIRDHLEFLLESHEPYPAFVLGRTWDIVMSNRPHRRMLEQLQAILGAPADDPENALRLVLAPDRLRSAIHNWPQVVRALIPRLERQVRIAAGDGDLGALRDEMLAYPGVREALEPAAAGEDEPALLVPIELAYEGERYSWYTTIASFGGAADVTTQEAVIESLLPADEATKRFAWQLAASKPETIRPEPLGS